MAVQVCYNITDENRNREINGLIEAMKKFDFHKGIIFTYNQEDKFSPSLPHVAVYSPGLLRNIFPVFHLQFS